MTRYPSARIHPTALIEDGAIIGENVYIGPYCTVGPHVQLGNNVHLVSHVSLDGYLTMGEHTKVYPFASLGHPPQDLKYKGEASRTIIGDHCTIREYVTIQPGTADDLMETRVGNHCLLMVGTHVAHDCLVGDHVIMANNATLAGHVTVGNHVIIGGLSAVQQFVRIGDHAIIGGMSGVEKDIIPYAMVVGERAHINGLNLVGLRRRGFSNQSIQEIMKAYEQLFDVSGNSTFMERVDKLAQTASQDEAIQQLIRFIQEDSKRRLCTPKTH